MLTKADISEFQKRFNDKLAHILNFKEKLTDEEAKKLGKAMLCVVCSCAVLCVACSCVERRV